MISDDTFGAIFEDTFFNIFGSSLGEYHIKNVAAMPNVCSIARAISITNTVVCFRPRLQGHGGVAQYHSGVAPDD